MGTQIITTPILAKHCLWDLYPTHQTVFHNRSSRHSFHPHSSFEERSAAVLFRILGLGASRSRYISSGIRVLLYVWVCLSKFFLSFFFCFHSVHNLYLNLCIKKKKNRNPCFPKFLLGQIWNSHDFWFWYLI